MNATAILKELTGLFRNFYDAWALDRDKIKGWAKGETFTAPGGGESFSLQVELPDPGYYTIQFGLQIPTVLDNAGIPVYAIKAQAEITWTVKGNAPIRRVIDVANGTSISGAGENVNIKLRNTSVGLTDPIPTKKFLAGVSVVPGVRPNMANSQPPMLCPYEAIVLAAAGGSSTFITPPEVGANAIFISVDPEANTDPLEGNVLTLTGDAFGPSGEAFEFQIGAEGFDKWIPIPPGVTNWTVTNNHATEEMAVIPMFGIEG